MVTTNVEISRKFTLQISQGNDGDIRLTIENEKGQFQVYKIDRRKLQVFAAMYAPVRDAVKFLIGEI